MRAGSGYTVRNLVSDGGVPAEHMDANLVNGWGIAAGPSTPWWVADNGTDVSTLYDGNGIARSLVVQVEGGPTGMVFNGRKCVRRQRPGGSFRPGAVLVRE